MEFFWMTTNPHGYVDRMLAVECTDPVLDRYYEIGVKLANDYRMAILDTYRIANPLNDLTCDGAHY